jgi:hypothetical protein
LLGGIQLLYVVVMPLYVTQRGTGSQPSKATDSDIQSEEEEEEQEAIIKLLLEGFQASLVW